MLLWLAVSAAALGGGFFVARDFVRRKLRFVDAIQHPAAPWIAGAAGAAISAGYRRHTICDTRVQHENITRTKVKGFIARRLRKSIRLLVRADSKIAKKDRASAQ